MTPEQEVKKSLRRMLECRNIEAVSRKTGYPSSTIRRWLKRPELISAVALLRIEQELGEKT